MKRIERIQQKIAHLAEKKQTLTGKKRRWCGYQLSKQISRLNFLLKLEQWGVALMIFGFVCIHYETDGAFAKDMWVYKCYDEQVVCFFEMNAGGVSCLKREDLEQ